MGRVLHTGQVVVDIVMRVGAVPAPGEDVFADHSVMAAGGGFNVMAAARRAGATVVHLGAVGDGPMGRIAAAALAAEGIATPTSPTAGTDTGYCVALVDATAERTFVSTRGAEAHLTPRHLEAVEAEPGDVVHVSGYSLLHPDNRAALLAWLAALPAGVTVIVDPSPLIADIPEDAWSAVVARTDLWTLNAREARLAAGRLGARSPGTLPAGANANEVPAELALLLAARLGRDVVVRAGADGAHVARPGSAVVTVPAIPVAAIDTNGTGDAHTGYVAAHLAAGGDLLTGVRRGNVAAAVAVTREGPATAPTAAEVDELLAGR